MAAVDEIRWLSMFRFYWFTISAAFLCSCHAPLPGSSVNLRRTYAAVFVDTAPVIDGDLDDPSWQQASWTAPYIDIEGDRKPDPKYVTRGKICWDETAVYFSAELEEPHLWSTLIQRDSIIYHDNDWEIFIDPDGDSLEYGEFEINTLGTEMDLLMSHPYRDGGTYDLTWDMEGIRSAVSCDGTINDPCDTDMQWTIEVAIPWSVFESLTDRSCPPEPGETWFINFSRVQWQLDIIDGAYSKRPDTPENNWTWSAQHAIDMHIPSRWGLVTFRPPAARR
jgi:hypothetical protein